MNIQTNAGLAKVVVLICLLSLVSAKLFSDQARIDTTRPVTTAGMITIRDKCMAKGGIGIIGKNLFVKTDTDRNEILLHNGKRWNGNAHGAQLVVIYDGEVLECKYPLGFDLSKCIIISFQEDKIVFLDLATSNAGYYERTPNTDSGEK